MWLVAAACRAPYSAPLARAAHGEEVVVMGRYTNAKKKPQGEPEQQRWVCSTCGVNVLDPAATGARSWGATGIWERAGAVVYHCDGKSFAFSRQGRYRDNPHHYPALNPPCRKCGAPMGCPRCSGPAEDLLCTASHPGLGSVWANAEAYAKHGCLETQTVADYMVEEGEA